MNPIRPTLTPNLQPQVAKPVETARAAAQKAFFEIALGRSPAPSAAPPLQASMPAATAQAAAGAQPAPRALPPGDSPARPLRPGSLLDIRV